MATKIFTVLLIIGENGQLCGKNYSTALQWRICNINMWYKKICMKQLKKAKYKIYSHKIYSHMHKKKDCMEYTNILIAVVLIQ